MTIRLLMTARDVAAALHLIQIARAARSDERFDVAIAAQQPAARHFLEAGFQVRLIPPLSTREVGSTQAQQLRAVARQLLREVQPDVVLVGLSTPFDAGIDEAVLAESSVPTVLFQDFWGEQNLLLGKGADLILAVDDEAVRLNHRRYGCDSLRVGSARHSAYSTLDLTGSRQRSRSLLGLDEQTPLIGFFGQALHHLEGYRRTVTHFVQTVAAMAEPVHVLVRAHPRENLQQRQTTQSLFIDSGLNLVPELDGSVEDALIACDVSCSLFSSCTYDAAYLNRFSDSPVTVPVSMLFDPQIMSYCEQHVNFDTFPYHRIGAVFAVHHKEQLAQVLGDAFKPAVHQQVWRHAHEHLSDPATAPQLALNAVATFHAQVKN